ncbi:microsomal signal peptidase 12 kDa subunit-domain-containing protein [Crepidotus variabilis]|uniref:Signal peptidase complex subunit 1 n=1 Tax=Crepidotus variabilis TaxID=179855 RepID=A0A9P6JSD0_9AGAR|nr:microsomal signal peptidase 12 kDa subunit-domain-containing protein [Crepidotus variabilis]
MSSIQDLTEGRIDFAGQVMVDNISRVALIVSTFIAFCIGFGLQDIRATFAFMAVAIVGLAAVVLPPWPMLNQNPVKWLPVKHKGSVEKKL